MEDYGQARFEDVYKAKLEPINVITWFDVELKLGLLTITLSYPRCLYAEFYKNEVYGEHLRPTTDGTKSIYG